MPEPTTLLHVAAAAVGLSALLASSATAFNVVKYVGAAYLIYLGLEALRSRPPDPDQPAAAVLSALGLVINSGYALAAGSARSWLRARPQVWARQRYLTGAVYLGLGVTAALSGRRPA